MHKQTQLTKGTGYNERNIVMRNMFSGLDNCENYIYGDLQAILQKESDKTVSCIRFIFSMYYFANTLDVYSIRY